MRAMREGAAGGVIKFILFGLLLLAVGGLVFMDIGGFFRNGGVKNSDVVKIGRESLSIQSFDQNVRRALQNAGVPAADAYKMGYIEELLNGEIRSALMYQASKKIGINIGRERIARQVHQIVAPMVEEGQSAQEALNRILAAQGMSEGQLVYSMSREASSGLLASAIQGGFAAVSDDTLRDFYQFENEKRLINLAVFLDKDAKAPAPASDEQLRQFYESAKESYAIPETREIVLAFVPDEKIKSTVSISEDEIKSAYDENIQAYSTAERRVLEQAILKSEEEAKTVLAKVQGGESLKSATTGVSKDTLSYVGEAGFEKEGLVPEIADLVFAQEKPGAILGPVKTTLGWHVIILKEIQAPKVKPIESVRKELEDELKQAKSSDAVYEEANAVDDALAGGASLDEAAKEHDLKLVSLPAFNTFGQDAKGNDALKDYAATRDIILKTAFDLGEGESSSVMELADGRFAAINIKAVNEKTYKPFEDVKDDIAKRWTQDQRHADNRLKITAALAQIKAGSKTLKDAAAENGARLRVIADMKRDGDVPAPLTPETRAQVFETPVGDYALLSFPEGTGIAQIATANFPKRDSISPKELDSLRADYLKSAQSEGMLMYLESARKKSGVKVNRELLETTYGAGREAQ